MCVPSDIYDDDSLPRIPVLVRVLDNIENIAAFDVKDDIFKRNAALRLQFLILRVVPREVFQCEL